MPSPRVDARRPLPSAFARRHRLALAAILLAFAAFAIACTRVTPIGGSPDEVAHLAYVQDIAYHLHFPAATAQERQQPPLYYGVAAVILKLTADPRLVRLVSVMFGLGMLLAVFGTARRLFPRRPWLGIGATALIALLPEAQYISGAVSDDAAAWCAGAILILLTVEAMLRPSLSTRLEIIIGVSIGAALITKETDWALALLLAAVVVVRHGGRLRWADAGSIGLPVLLIAGWWFGRNVVAFHSLLPPFTPITNKTQVLHEISQVRGYVAATLDSVVGTYGNGAVLQVLQLPGGRALPSALVEICTVVLIGAAAGAAWVSRRRWETRQRSLALVLMIALSLVILQSIANSVRNDLQPQGRYLLVAAAAGAPIVAWTLAWRHRADNPLPTWKTAVLSGLPLVGVCLDVFGVMTAAHA